MSEILTLPAEITFANNNVEAADQSEGPVTFHIVANSGSKMSFPWGDVVIDMNGVRCKKANIPILYGHDSESINAGIGHSVAVSVQNGQIVIVKNGKRYTISGVQMK